MLKIRQFCPLDLHRVWQIGKISFPKVRLYSQGFFRKHYQLHPEGFFVAEEEDIVGYVLGFPNQDGVQISSLAVEPTQQRYGIGTKLINSLTTHFKKQGFRHAFLYVRTDNAAAVSFYHGLDFNASRIIKKHYSNGDNAYLMVKAI
jgi:ribosomal protein S18 acetylase RimI-like enzyme